MKGEWLSFDMNDKQEDESEDGQKGFYDDILRFDKVTVQKA